MIVALDLLARAKGGEGVKSGPIGLAVILVLCVVAYFLFKSMSKHLRRVRDDFPVEPRHTGTHPATTVPPAADESVRRDEVQSAEPPPPDGS